MHNQATKHLRCRRWIALGALATGLAAATSPVQADTFLYLPYLSATVTDPIAAVGQLGGQPAGHRSGRPICVPRNRASRRHPRPR